MYLVPPITCEPRDTVLFCIHGPHCECMIFTQVVVNVWGGECRGGESRKIKLIPQNWPFWCHVNPLRVLFHPENVIPHPLWPYLNKAPLLYSDLDCF